MKTGVKTITLIHKHDIAVKSAAKEANVDTTSYKFFIVILDLTLPNAKTVTVIGRLEKPCTDTNRKPFAKIRRLVRQWDTTFLRLLFFLFNRFRHDHINRIDNRILNGFSRNKRISPVIRPKQNG